jgi:hypothetical protein
MFWRSALESVGVTKSALKNLKISRDPKCKRPQIKEIHHVFI